MEGLGAHLGPPPADSFDGELGGVGNIAHRNPAFVVEQVVNAVGDRFAPLPQGPVGEVVDPDAVGLTFW
jgi:hypothetical protein